MQLATAFLHGGENGCIFVAKMINIPRPPPCVSILQCCLDNAAAY